MHEYKGENSRLDEIQAAVLSVKLQRLDADNDRRRQIAAMYNAGIKNKAIILPKLHEKEEHVWHIYCVRVQNRKAFIDYLKDCGIETVIHYPTSPHKQKAYKEWNALSFPITECIHREELSIPCNQTMSLDDAKLIVTLLNNFH